MMQDERNMKDWALKPSKEPVQEPQASLKGASVFRSAFVMAMGTFSSRLIALLREVVLAAYFPRFVTDVWIVALRIPNLCRRLFGEGSLSVAFIPIFVELLESGQSQRAKQLVNAVFSLILVSLLALFSLGLIFTPQIIHWLTVGDAFSQIQGKVQLTIYFARIMMGFLILVCLYAFFMAIQNSLQRFAIAAFAPALFNLSIVAAAFVPTPFFDIPGEILAWAVLVGGVLQLVVVLPGVWRLGFFPCFSWNLLKSMQFAPARRVLQKLLPSLIGVGVLQLTVLVNTRFASYLQEGANSWMFWADRLLELPLSLIAVSMGVALLPTLSKYFAQGLLKDISLLMNQSLRYIFFLAIPAGLALFVLSELLVQVIFQRGHFDVTDTFYTSAVLKIYGAGLFAYAGIRTLQMAFYAVQNTWLPAIVSAVCLIFHILLASYLLEPYQVEGLAFSSVASATLNLFLLLIAYRTLIGHLIDFVFVMSLFRTLAASIGMAVGLHFVILRTFESSDFFLWPLLGVFWGNFLLLGFLCVFGLGFYLTIAFALRSQETIDILRKALNSLKHLKIISKNKN